MEERRILMEEHQLRDDLGITSKPHLLAVIEGITVDKARDLLLLYEVDRARFDPSTTPDADADAVTDP
jgi:hypothetical protein